VSSCHLWRSTNEIYHLINEHGNTPPSFPGQFKLLIQIFIAKEEESALGIKEMVTNSWREQNNIPDSGGFHENGAKYTEKGQI
jgi:hypothetical protein